MTSRGKASDGLAYPLHGAMGDCTHRCDFPIDIRDWVKVSGDNINDLTVKTSEIATMAYTKQYRTRFAKKKSAVPVKVERVHRDWSDYQKAIFKEVAEGTGNVQVDALAGSGKTSTIIESFYYLPPNRSAIMVAFNASIKEELASRAPSTVKVSTLHSLGFQACIKSLPRMSKQIDKRSEKVEGYIRAVVGDDKEDYDLRANLKQCVSLCKGYVAETSEEIDQIMDRHGIDTIDMPREKFIGTTMGVVNACKKDTSRIDFDDMVWLPVIHGMQIPKFGFVFVDESQDLNKAQIELGLSAASKWGRVISVGDEHQCVSEDTIVQTEMGERFVYNLEEGDKILSYRNGKNSYQTVKKIWKSKENHGLEIITESGYRLMMTPSHQLWASVPERKNDEHIVYLMYREGFGYRIGVTNKGYSKDSRQNFSNRLVGEGADKMWIIDWCDSYKQAHTKEILYSLQYGIPTCVFRGSERGLDMDHIKTIFHHHGKNGIRLLEEKLLEKTLPHWQAYSASRGSIHRNVIRFVEHGPKGSHVSLEWTAEDDSIIDALFVNGIEFSKAKGDNRYRLRKWFISNREALAFATLLSNILDIPIVRKLSCKEAPLNLTTASGLHVGMRVPVCDGDGFKLETIIKINKVESNFVDIEIDDSANFYGNGILTHNCIYGFRGADQDAIQNIVDRMNSKRMVLSVTYRCASNIVELAKQYVPELEAAPNAPDGLVESIGSNGLEEKVQPGDFVLSRVNAPLISWCLTFLRAGIPANIQGKDLARNMMAMVRKSKADSVMELLQWVQEWRTQECERLEALGRDFEVINDKAACIEAVSEGCHNLDQVMYNIDKLFHEGDDAKDRVMLSTTHKAKGLERNRVFLLRDTYRPGQTQEETNLMYVAITRAMRELYLVSK